MHRTTKYFSIAAGGTPQPLIGTTLTTAAGPAADSRSPNVELTVGDSSFVAVGEYVIIGNPGSTNERKRVTKVRDGTHLTVENLENSYTATVFIRLAQTVNSLYVQTLDGNTGAIFIGNSSTMVKATGVGVIKKLVQVAANAAPTDWTSSLTVGQNPVETSDYWVDGTTSDKYLPSWEVL